MHLLAMAANYHSGSGSYPSCSRIITPNESGGAGFLALLSCLRVTDSQRHLAFSTPCHRGTLLIHVPWHHIQTEKFSCEKTYDALKSRGKHHSPRSDSSSVPRLPEMQPAYRTAQLLNTKPFEVTNK